MALQHLAFEVESVAEATAFLQDRGLQVRETRACRSRGRQIWITDPDGHMVILFETETNDLAQGC
jgi:catechol 2,3-dioxygenase-like lactoylglutathione lyase family enzyme